MSRHDEQGRRQGGSRGGQERGNASGAFGLSNPGRQELPQEPMGSWRGGRQMQGQHDPYEDRHFENQRAGGGAWPQGGGGGGGYGSSYGAGSMGGHYGGGEGSMSGGRGDMRFGDEGYSSPGYGNDAFRGSGNFGGWNSSTSSPQFSSDFGGRSVDQTGGRSGGMSHQGRGQGGQDQSHWDPDYHQWRSEQVRALDEDYDNWRQDRYKKFSDEFSEWRKNRPTQGQRQGHGEQEDNSDILSPGSGNVGASTTGMQDNKAPKKSG